MANFPELDRVSLTLLQVTGLLFPVIFLTMSFLKREGYDEQPSQIQNKIANSFIVMVFALTSTGFTATLGILDTAIKDWILFFSVVSLLMFFMLYGRMFLVIVRAGDWG